MRRSTAYDAAQAIKNLTTCTVEVYQQAGYWPNQWTVRVDFGDETYHLRENYEKRDFVAMVKREQSK